MAEWFYEECAEATKRKSAAYMRLLNRRTRQVEEEYKQLRREEKKIHKGKKKKYMQMEVQELDMQKEARKFYKKLNESRQDFKPKINLCRNRAGEILSEEQQILERWTEHFEEHLKLRAETTEIELDMEDDREKDILPMIEEVQDVAKKK